MGARTAHALDLGGSSTGSALSALWKVGSGFPVDPCASEAAPLLRAFAQVPWRCPARAMANFHCEVAAYHPLPKTPCAAIGRCRHARPPYLPLYVGWIPPLMNDHSKYTHSLHGWPTSRVSMWHILCPTVLAPPGLAMRARRRKVLRPDRVSGNEARSPPARSACLPHPQCK